MNIFRRIETREISDVTVVSFTERKILEAAHIQELGEELLALARDRPNGNFILDFDRVEFLTSASVNKLIIVDMILRKADGVLLLCNLMPEVRELFVITRTSQLFGIKEGLKEALEILAKDRILDIECAMQDCGCRTRTTFFRTLADHWKVVCASCGTCARLNDFESPTGPMKARVLSLTFHTYDTEYVRVDCTQWTGSCTTAVEGRLDLFVADVVNRACSALPSPRRIVIDLRRATDVSDKGAVAICEICCRTEGDKATILIDGEKHGGVAAFNSNAFVHNTKKAAVAALGEVPDEAKQTLTVTIRCMEK